MGKSVSERQTADEIILIDKAVIQDADAFGRLYDMHVDRVYRHIFYRVGSEADAEDLTQQVFLKAWQGIGRYRRRASPFVAWLLTISHNLVVDFYRTRKDRTYLEIEALAGDAAYDPERAAEASLDQARLRRGILQLRGDEQQVVIMRFMEGFEYAEIASEMNKKEGNIRVIVHRALLKLRAILENEGVES